MPAMNIESTIDTSAVVTPNWAIDKRSHTSSYRMLQKPDRKKNAKYQPIDSAVSLHNEPAKLGLSGRLERRRGGPWDSTRGRQFPD